MAKNDKRLAMDPFSGRGVDSLIRNTTADAPYTPYASDTSEASSTPNASDTPNASEEPDASCAPQKPDAPVKPAGKYRDRPRISLSFTDENLEHLQSMAALSRTSITQYLNTLVDSDRAEKAEIVSRMKDLAKGGKR